MAQDTVITYGVLNVAAHPHERGIYIDLLQRASNNPVKFWGDEFASITPPIERESDLYQGRIVLWTEIDPLKPAILKDKLSEVSLADLDVSLPDNVGFNGRIFLYTLRESDHKLFFEAKNEFGRTLSPTRARRIFTRLLSPETLGSEAPLVEVTVVPDDDSLDRVFAMSRIRRLDIHLVRPNPDDISEDVANVLAELEEQGARTQDLSLIASPGESVAPNERTSTLAAIAATNGFVRSAGRDEDGEISVRSTKEYPKLIRRAVEEIGSVASSAISAAKTKLRNL